MVEIREWDDEGYVVHAHELTQRRHVSGIVDAGNECVRIRVIQRGSERVDVAGERAGARAPEGGDDVDPLAGAREENSEQRAAEGTVASVRRLLLFTLAGLVAAWIGVSLVLFVWPPAETGAPGRADVVVVLSGATDRLPPALALIRRGVAPVLAISSVSQTPKWLRARRLCRAGRYARARILCFEATPYSTRGEAETIARLARLHRWHSIVVVTSTYHVTRAHLLFSRCYSGKLSFVGAGAPWWVLPWEWANETGKLVVQETAERGC